ncbi:hypothetical protein [Urechidicola sp. KH5]
MIIIILFDFTGCTESPQKNKSIKDDLCTLEIHSEILNNEWIYLYRLVPYVKVIDSINLNSKFSSINFPNTSFTRFGIGNSNDLNVFIASKDTLQVFINNFNPLEVLINNDLYNNALIKYKNESRHINAQIDAFFPEIQRARLANDSDKILEINNAIKNIETRQLEHSITYIKTNESSFVSIMILHDLLKNERVSMHEAQELYAQIDHTFKNTQEARIIEQILILN